MSQDKKIKLWVPYAIVLFGILVTLIVAIATYIRVPYFHQAATTYHPLIILFVGISVSLLIAAFVRIAQVARLQAYTLNQVNEDLKKEISERINMEADKQKLEIALLQGQKLQAMGTLAGGIAHDFNNILYAVIGYAEMSREDVEKDSQTYKNLGKVLDAAARGQELVARILAFSRRQHHHHDIINLKATIENALSLLTPTIPASVIIQFEAKGNPVILGNQTQIHQVIVNIINNAVDAMDGEGVIDIRMAEITPEDPVLKQFTGKRTQNYCKIEITDTGHGMDQNTIERIFDPFFTTKEVGKGTGLGLSIVHTIIKEHEGNISVTSQLGHGSTFLILLPEYTAE